MDDGLLYQPLKKSQVFKVVIFLLYLTQVDFIIEKTALTVTGHENA